jgi:peptidoglycan hydrolase-like amidase
MDIPFVKKIAAIFVCLILLLIISPNLFHPIYADEIEDLQKQIDELNKSKKLSEDATKPLEGQVDSLRRQIAQIQASINGLNNKITVKEQELSVREDKLALQQVLMQERVKSYYIRSYLSSPLMIILSSVGSGDIFRELSYRQSVTQQDQKVITEVTKEVVQLLQDKEKLEKDKKSMAGLQAQVDQNADFLDGEIKKAKDYQSTLTKQIADLSAKQQAIINAKSGTFTTSVGDVPLADDPASAPNYNPGFSPAFAAFSFGAYTHRNGMSQYGAKGRAESGQSAEQILAAYYPGSSLNKSYGVPGTINVTGYGSMPFEDQYMMRIYEMPNSFPKEALKAQAVAARTYAVRQGGTICATESCQVYKHSDKGGAWADAVRETRGWVLEGGANAQYSSTTGGYGNNSGWDTKCGSKDCWTADAYEKIASSPWFYKGWYKDRSGATCGRSHPWLNTEEMSDILNSWIVYQSGSDRDRISPVDTSCWPGSPFSISEMRNKANDNGGAVTAISSVSVSYSTGGSTATVTFGTNRGTMSIPGSDFKTIFNLRAPGYVSIKSPLFNMERK